MSKWELLLGILLCWQGSWAQEESAAVPTAIYIGNALFEAPVEGVDVTLVLQENTGNRRRPVSTPVGKYTSDNLGVVTVSLIPDKQYLIQASKAGYYTQLSKIKTTDFSRTRQNKTGISLRPRNLVSIKGNIAKMDDVDEEGRRITIINKNNRHVRVVPIDANGDYDLKVMKDSDYDLHIYVEGLVDTVINVGQKDLAAQSNALPVVFNIVPSAPRPNYQTGDLLALDSYNLRFIERTSRLSSEVWVDTLTRILRDHPTVQLTLNIHTDARKSDRLNLLLSKRRAALLREELEERGIRPEQYQFELKGEDEVLNGCIDGVRCTSREHAVNNRVTVEVAAGAFYFKNS